MRSQAGTPKRYRYTGAERDQENDLNYHGARYCAPWLGRWISPDPAGLADGNNMYWYGRDNPVVLVDPEGRDSKDPELNQTSAPGPKASSDAADQKKGAAKKKDDDKSEKEGSDEPNPSPITQASLTNQGPNVLKEGQNNMGVQLGGGFSVGGNAATGGGTGQFPTFQVRLGFGLSRLVSLHLLGTASSQGPERPSLEGTIPNSSPGSLGGFVQIGTDKDTGPGVYLGLVLLTGQNPQYPNTPSPVTGGNFVTSALFAYSGDASKVPIIGPLGLKYDANLLLAYQNLGMILGNPASTILTAAPALNLSRQFTLEQQDDKPTRTLTVNVENRLDFNGALNNSLPVATDPAGSYVYSLGAGIQYSNLPGHFSLGFNAFMKHEMRFDETPFNSQKVPQPYNFTLLPSISGYF